MLKVLVLDDDEYILKALKRFLPKQSFFIHGERKTTTFDFFSNPLLALEQVSNHNYDIIISDYKMPQMNGVEFLKKTYLKHPNTIRLILSGQTDREGLIKAINEAKIYQFIEKPWNEENLISIIQQALNLKRDDDIKTSNFTEKDLLLEELEEEEPGITQVKRSPEGYILLDLDEEE